MFGRRFGDGYRNAGGALEEISPSGSLSQPRLFRFVFNIIVGFYEGL